MAVALDCSVDFLITGKDHNQKIVRCNECEHYKTIHCTCNYIDDLCDDVLKLLKEQPQWISVKDGLPEKPDFYPHSAIRRSYFLVALKSGCVMSLGFDFDRMEWHYTASPVTHWMPLPEPPEEVAKAE